jgi:hypothetical protein
MESTIRMYVRTGIVGAWAVFLGVALVLTASRLLELFDPSAREEGVTSLASAGIPLAATIADALVQLYNGGAASVILGILLVFIGLYQLLRTA